MKLVSENNVTETPIKVLEYDTFLKRFRGLMFRMKPIVNEGILIKPCNSIHMFFMFFSIDVAFLNDQNQIVHLRENVRPWTLVLPIKNAKAALELPAGSIAKHSIKVGETIEI